MIFNSRICAVLMLILCVIATGCTGRKDSEDGYYRGDSIGDAGLGGITDMNSRKSADGESEIAEYAGTWYEQSGRRARIRIRDKSSYLSYNIDGGWKYNSWHEERIVVSMESDGTYIFRFENENSFLVDIRYKSEEDIIIAVDNEGTESVFKRMKYIPDAEELKKEAKEYPAPDESFCGNWQGYFEEGSGSYNLTLTEPDESGIYHVEASFSKTSDNSGKGHAGLSVDITDINAEAVVSDGVMMVTGSYYGSSSKADSEKTIKAVLEQYNGGLRLIVLECDASMLQPGDWFNLIREE